MVQKIKKIGIFGGGQLGRMMAQAALPLGVECVFFEQQVDCPSSAVGQVISSEQENALQTFIQSADVFTLEFENTSIDHVDRLIQQKTLYPPREALAISQNRLSEKALFTALNIPVAPYHSISNFEDLQQAVEQIGLPIVLKTATGGYDGKGQFVIKETNQIQQAWEDLKESGILIAEGFVSFTREMSIIAVRGQNGEIKTWDLAENCHHNGILSHSIVPAPNSKEIQPIAKEYITKILNHLNYVGVLTLEFFVTNNGLVANEIAPRVHNSGHWTIEGAICSQFENHIRAVAGLPLGSTQTIAPNIMVNIIGQHPDIESILALEGVHLHLYNKAERVGRKLGHITIMPTNNIEPILNCQKIAKLLPVPLALKEDMPIGQQET